jgi:16S rRNA (guanine(527)-N(7))-methyltransferase RsmG
MPDTAPTPQLSDRPTGSGDDVDPVVALREHVELLAAHYELSGDVATALGTLAAMAGDPYEDVLPRRPATTRLIATRLSSCAAAVELELVRSARRIVDIGSGLGFPGLVLASMLPDAGFTLVEQSEKRSAFLRRAVAAMGLTSVEIVHNHAQRWMDGVMSADVVTARSVGRLKVMVGLAAPLLALGGTAVIFGNPKRDTAKEAEAREAAEAAGLRPVTVHRTTPVGLGARYLYLYEKVSETPSRRSLKANRGIDRQTQYRARAQATTEAHRKAAERLERTVRRVQQLEAAQAEHPGTAAELERAREVARKMKRKVEVLAERHARAERRLGRASNAQATTVSASVEAVPGARCSLWHRHLGDPAEADRDDPGREDVDVRPVDRTAVAGDRQ